MKSSVKKLKNCKVKLTVEVDAKAVEARFQEVFREIQRVAQLPGFRQGKAPVDLVQKKYAGEAYEEVLKSLIPDTYHQALLQQKLTPASLPSIADIKMERGKALSYSAELEERPDFSLKNYKGIKLQKTGADVHDKDVDEGIRSLLDSRAEFLPILETRAVKHGDFVRADIEIWAEDKYVPGKQGALLSVQPAEGDDFYQKVIGAQINEVREVVVGEKPLYKVWIREIQEKRVPELTDELAKMFGKDSVDALRTAVRSDIESYKQSEARETMKEALFEKLLGLVSFDLPESLVAKQKDRLMDQARKQAARSGRSLEASPDLLKKTEEEASVKARNQVKLYFILQKISEAEGIEADEAELEKRLAGLAAQSQRPIDEVRRVFEDDLRESLKEAKTIDFLLANAKTEEPQPTSKS